MGVLLNSGDLSRAVELVGSNPGKAEIGNMVMTCEPIIEMTSKRFPLYLREDLKQEVRMDLYQKCPTIAGEYKAGKIRELMGFMFRTLSNSATDFFRAQAANDCKFVRIDDIHIEVAVYPKTYEKSKMIHRIQTALEHFYKSRYPEDEYAERASRFAYIMLSGKRPNFTTNNLQRFFNGNRIAAYQAYTTALIMIKRLLEVYGEES